MLAAGQMVHSAGERETARWLNESSALCELLGAEREVYDNAMHPMVNMLWRQHDKVERQLAYAAREAFGLDETTICSGKIRISKSEIRNKFAICALHLL
jgi:hypothetical protein